MFVYFHYLNKKHTVNDIWSGPIALIIYLLNINIDLFDQVEIRII